MTGSLITHLILHEVLPTGTNGSLSLPSLTSLYLLCVRGFHGTPTQCLLDWLEVAQLQLLWLERICRFFWDILPSSGSKFPMLHCRILQSIHKFRREGDVPCNRMAKYFPAINKLVILHRDPRRLLNLSQ